MSGSEIIIEAGKSNRAYWQDLWRFRELFYFLTWRDVMVRYKQTAIGVAWVLIRPLLFTGAFALLFRGKGLGLPDVPYSLFIFVGMLPWQLFATAMNESSGSLISNANLVSKVYFPRLMVPASAVATAIVDFVVSLMLLAVMMLIYRIAPDWRLIFIPAFTALALMASLGLGLWFAALNVKYRDFRYIVPFAVQLGMFVSPVFHRPTLPSPWGWIYDLNPMVAVIDGFRWALFRGRVELNPTSLLITCAVVTTLVVSGLAYFRRMEREFVDVL